MKSEVFQVLLNFVLSFIRIFILFTLFTTLSFADSKSLIEINGLNSMTKEEFLYLLDIDKNKSINEEKINEGIKRLFLKDFFEDIIVEKKDSYVKISVLEKPVVQSIKIQGNKYFDDSFYKKIIPLKVKDKLTDLKLRKSINVIKENLIERGFNNSEVKFIKDCKEQKCYITFIIVEGNPQIIKEINLIGDVDDYIDNFLNIRIGEPFDKVQINKFIDKVKNYYEKKKLIGTKIVYKFENNKLSINIIKGKSIEVELLGVEELSKKDLLDIIFAHFQDSIDEKIIRDSINSLIYFYQINGFLDVKIYPLIEETDSLFKISYLINEGKQKIVEEIKLIFLENNLQDESKEIVKILSNSEGSNFKPELLEDDRKKIEDFLKTKGYYLTKVYPVEIKEKDEKIKISFKINEGKKFKIKNIFLKVNDNILYDNAIETLNYYKDKVFNDSIFTEIKRKLLEIYQKSGYIDAAIDANYELKDNEVDIYISLNPNKKNYFGKSIILGNKKTKTKFIYDRLIEKENNGYNPYILEEERQILYKTGLFSRVDINTQKLGDSIDVLYNIEETPAGAVEFGLGYGEYERAKGFIELSYINLFGTNKQIFSRIELSTIEKRAYLTYVDPWLWKNLTFKSAVSYEDTEVKNIDTKDILYKLKKLGFSVGFEKKLFENFKFELLYEGTYTKTSDVLPEVIISDQDVGKLFISGFKGSIIYDTRDNPFDPKKGWLAGISSKISTDTIGSEINFNKTSFYINKYTEIFNGLVLATSLRGGWIWLYGDTKDMPISERFFLGGRETVRGYAQNTLGPKNNNQPIGGNAFLMGNIEIRSSLGKNFFLVNFLDFGNVWKRVGDAHITDLKYTTGLGLRYKTPIGPIRIDYGYKLNREKDESHGEIHFSIGHAF